MEKYFAINALINNTLTGEEDFRHVLQADTKEESIKEFTKLIDNEIANSDILKVAKQETTTGTTYVITVTEDEIITLSHISASEIKMEIQTDLDVSEDILLEARQKLSTKAFHWSDGQSKHVAWDCKLSNGLWLTDLEANNELTVYKANLTEW